MKACTLAWRVIRPIWREILLFVTGGTMALAAAIMIGIASSLTSYELGEKRFYYGLGCSLIIAAVAQIVVYTIDSGGIKIIKGDSNVPNTVADTETTHELARIRRQWGMGGVPEYVADMFTFKLGRIVQAVAVGSDGGSIELGELAPGTIGWMKLSPLTMSAEFASIGFAPREAVLRSRWSPETPLAFYKDDSGNLYALVFGDHRITAHRTVIELSDGHAVRFGYLGTVGDEPLRNPR